MPWKFRVHREKERWQDHLLVRIAFLLFLCLVAASLPYVWGRYQRWNDRRKVVGGQRAFLRGEYREALLRARGIPKTSPLHQAAEELATLSKAALQSPEAMSWRQMRNAMETGDGDQLLGLAEGFIRAEDFATAKQVLAKVKPEDQKSARFHDLAAKVALKTGDPNAASTHWTEAIKENPSTDEYRLQLIALQLASEQAETRATALSSLEEIKVKPGGRLPALRTLLADLKRRDDKAQAREIAAEIAADPAAEFSDKLALLTTLRSLRPKRDAEFAAYLAELQGMASADPQFAFALISWMVDHDLALAVPEWEPQLPPEFSAEPPVAPVIAAAYSRANDWKGLRKHTEAAAWGDMEFLRLAFLSLALEHLGEAEPSKATWTETLKAAQARPELLDRLARATHLWGWKDRTEEVLWKLAPSEWCPRWAMEYLWASAWARGDTLKLHEVSKLRVKAQPGNLDARNNEVALALLAGQGGDATLRAAEDLFKENPKNSFAASTYGFSLYLQGRAKEAVAILDNFPPAELHRPAVAQYFGIFLAAAEEMDRAGEYLQLASKAAQLPEEKSLVSFFTALSNARLSAVRGDEPGAQLAWNEAISAGKTSPDRLEQMAKMALNWGWQPRAEAALLRLAEFDRCPAWAADTLWAAALKTRDSGQIYRASQLVAKATPDSVSARNHFLLLALLGRHEKDAPFPLLEAFYKQHPGHPEATATYALALSLQGKSTEAVALLAALTPEQLREPRSALYFGLCLAAAGRMDEAQPQLALGTPAVQFPDEDRLTRILQFAIEASQLNRGGDARAADSAWNQALATAEGRADWLEMLTKMSIAAGPERHANAALWKLSGEEACPRWAIDALWSTTLNTGTPAQRYQASKLLLKADPKNVTARANAFILALLTGEEVEAPLRQVEAFYQSNLTQPDAIVAYGLCLYSQGRRDDALTLMGALTPKQLQAPRVALYYGIFLASTETPEKALDYLRLGLASPVLPEERSLVEKVATVEPLKSLLTTRP